jgi:hypothetical protein
VGLENKDVRAAHTTVGGAPRDWRVLVAVWIVVLIALPLRLIQHGFLPPDDALRYAARAVSGKSWAEIMVIRPEITIDHNPGWNLIQGIVHRVTNWDERAIVQFSVMLLFGTFAVTPLFLLRRPEIWIASLTLLMAMFPYFAERLMVGRPLLLTTAIMLVLMWLWVRIGNRKALAGEFVASIVLVGLSVWIHGSWYLLGMVPAVFLLSRRWRAAGILGLCWILGTVTGAILSGHPWRFLYESALIPVLALGQKVPLNALAGEFQAYSGGFPAVLLVGVILALRYARGLPLHPVSKDPFFWMALLGWVLGYRVFRFWLDWGLPALAFWTAVQAGELLDSMRKEFPLKWRFGMGVVAAMFLFAFVADDREQRWSQYSQFVAMDARQPEHAGWLPDKGGILYSVNMSVFYETFFMNPHGDWRYALGFEPSFMLPEDYAVFRELWETLNALKAVQPWVEKMRAEDRLVLLGPEGTPPAIPQLEWGYVVNGMWVGRRPREASAEESNG